VRFDGRTALVTGGASGIGAAICRRLSDDGCRLAVLDLDGDGAEDVARSLATLSVALQCDVTDESSVASCVAATVERLGGLDIVVNNAGVVATVSSLEELDVDDWDRVIDVHLKGCFLVSKHALPVLRERGGGVLINMASTAGVRGKSQRYAYVAAKHGVVGLTKSIALDYVGAGIRAVAVAPGGVDTPMLRRGAPALTSAERAAKYEAHVAGGGSAVNFTIEPDAVAEAVCYLASSDSVNITGVVLSIDGGSTI
jgi:NAD(P)-dependent dehydrogenase (short-subunit alcohol dehydrogenase family)